MKYPGKPKSLISMGGLIQVERFELEPQSTQRALRRAFLFLCALCRERKLPRRHRDTEKRKRLFLCDSVAKAFMTEGDKPSS